MTENVLELIQQIQKGRYAKQSPKAILLAIMDEVRHKTHEYNRSCWEVTIELLGDHLGIMTDPWKYSLPKRKWTGKTSKPTSPHYEDIKKAVDDKNLLERYVTAAHTQPWDHLGDIFTELELAGRHDRLAQVLTPRGIIEFMVEACIGQSIKRYSYVKPDFATLAWQTIEALLFNDALPINLQVERARRHTVLDMTPLLVKYEPKPVADLDPCTGSGRFLLVASLKYPDIPLTLYGIEIDYTLYKACLVNMALFACHPYSIVRADALMLDARFQDSPVWMEIGNQWDPPDPTPYYMKPKPKPNYFEDYMKWHYQPST